MEIYLLADCLLLCDVFENFRSNCLQQYNIDLCYYFSAPHFTFNAFLRHSSLTLELLSDINQCGRAMQEYLPQKNFEWMSPHQLNYDFIKGLEPEGEVGCIIQCSLEYSVALHDYHSDYP